MEHHRSTRDMRGSPSVAEPVRIWLLGGFEMALGTQTVGGSAWRPRKAPAPVKLFALAQGHAMHRERVLELLWPHLDQKSASNNLHRALHFARGVLDPAPADDVPGRRPTLLNGLVELCRTATLWMDAEAFEELAGSSKSGANVPGRDEARARKDGSENTGKAGKPWASVRRALVETFQPGKERGT